MKLEIDKLTPASFTSVRDRGFFAVLLQRCVDRFGLRPVPHARCLRHVDTLTLAPKQAVYLVECDGERFLLSAAGDSISAPVRLTKTSESICGTAGEAL